MARCQKKVGRIADPSLALQRRLGDPAYILLLSQATSPHHETARPPGCRIQAELDHRLLAGRTLLDVDFDFASHGVGWWPNHEREDSVSADFAPFVLGDGRIARGNQARLDRKSVVEGKRVDL